MKKNLAFCMVLFLLGCSGSSNPDDAGFILMKETVDTVDGYYTECGMYSVDDKTPRGIPVAASVSPGQHRLVVRCIMSQQRLLILQARIVYEYKFDVTVLPKQSYYFHTFFDEKGLSGWFDMQGVNITDKQVGVRLN